MKRQAELSLFELSSANFDNQVLTVLRSGKETQVTQTYGKKVVDGANNSTEATEEPTKLLTVSMPLAMFKRAITQRGLSNSKFVEDFNINLLAVNFCGQMCPFSLCLPKFSLGMLLLLLTWEVLVWLSLVLRFLSESSTR